MTVSDACSPSFCGGHGVLGQIGVIDVREDRKVDDAQRAIVTRDGWLPTLTKSSPTRGVITMLPALSPTQTVFSQRRQRQAREAGLPHPVTQKEGVSAIHQQDIGVPHPLDPALLANAGQRGEFQHSQ